MEEFAELHDISLRSITIDFRKTKTRYSTEGLFGGFKDMYDGRRKTLYFNPNNFIEFNTWHIPKNIAHLIMHEMIHAKQIQTKEMVIINPNKLEFKGKLYI